MSDTMNEPDGTSPDDVSVEPGQLQTAARPRPLEECLSSGGFLWLTGIEDTFITAPFPRTKRTLDEYELTRHYQEWRGDLDKVAALGVRVMRYGVPWHRINPSPQVWDFGWTDEVIDYMLGLGIEPIIDLVHYGVPSWIEGAFLHPQYERYVEEYALRLAERFRGRVRYFTPLNEPRVTAWYTGRLGWWPPFKHGWQGFAKVILAICRGVVRTERALRAVLDDVVCVHVDAGDIYDSTDPALASDVAHRQEIGFLALDLVSGKVDACHPLHEWLHALGASSRELDWFLSNAIDPDIIGVNASPLLCRKILTRNGGRLRTSMPYASVSTFEQVLRTYHDRYKKPLIVTETGSEGSVKRRLLWLEESVAAVARLRASGVPIMGYTWWPLFALVTWAYRQGTKPVDFYLKQMGLWDLVAGDAGALVRTTTPLVEAYRELVSGGQRAVGAIGASRASEVSPTPLLVESRAG
jgi:beta-glucosidase/6-phospho-beta-glucosidase/beta-galactosidase